MKKLSNNPIDQYFRETLESPDLKYNKRDWRGVETRLPRRSKKKVLAWLLPIAAAILIFISLWLFKSPLTENNHFSKSDTGYSIKSEPNNALASDKQEQTGRTKSDIDSTSSFLSKKPLKSESFGNIQAIDSIATVSPFSTPNPSDSHHISSTPVKLLNAFLSDKNDFKTPEIKDLNILPVITDPEQNISKRTSGQEINSRLSLALTISPDFNSVNHFSESDFGTSLGLGASFNITRRLSIRTGVGYSKKTYSAMPHEYKAPWASSSAGKYAKSINADCRVFDVPVSFNYAFSTAPKQTFFVSAGLSSYFMLKETYTLVGSNQSGYPPKTNLSYSYKNDNKHLLSIINLSMGMSRPISKHTSIVIEPYVKMPFTGIGQGKVNLQSAGINFQLQYNFPRKIKLNSSSLDAAQ
jgi:hypothetical protein